MLSDTQTQTNSLEGFIADVISSVAGTSLTTDALAGDTTLFVEDTSSFDEGGGQLKLSDAPGTVLDYLFCDKDLEVIELALGLPAALTEGDIISVYPTEKERWATVNLPGYDDPLIAVVPFSIAALLPEGSRSAGAAETVLVSEDPNGWVVVDVLVDPSFDGAYVAPGTLPSPTFTSDGVPPSYSPAPSIEGGVGFLLVKWAAVPNHDPVTYEIHISVVNDFVPDTTTLSGKTTSQFFFITGFMPDGTPLQYFLPDGITPQVYYVKIVATDVDPGAAPPSTQGSGSMLQVTGPDIVVGAITAFSGKFAEGAIGTADIGNLVADKIGSGNIVGQLVMSGSIIAPAFSQTVPGPGTTGLTYDSQGFRAYGADGTVAVDISADGSSPYLTNAHIDVTALSIRSGFSYQDPDGSMQPSSKLTLESSVQPPPAPSVSEAWPTVQLTWLTAFGHAGHINGVDNICYDALGGALNDTPVFYTLTWCSDTSVEGGVTYTSPLYLTEHLASSGQLNRFNAESIDRRLDLISANITHKSEYTDYGVTRVGPYLFVLVDYITTDGGYAARWLRYNQSDLSYNGTGRITVDIPGGANSGIEVMTCSDPLNGAGNLPAVVFLNNQFQIVIKTYTDTSMTTVASSRTLTGGLSGSAFSPWGAVWDGGNWWVVMANNNGNLAQVQEFIGGTNIYASAHDFSNVAGAPGSCTNVNNAARGRMFAGVAFASGGIFYTSDGTAVYQHSMKEWRAAGANPWWVGYTWTDVASVPVHETTVGPRQSIKPGNRSVLNIALRALPTGPSGANVYVQQSALDPDVLTFGHLLKQGANVQNSLALGTFTSGAAADPLSGNFPASMPAIITDVGGTWSLSGDGTAKFPFHGCLVFKSAPQNVADGTDVVMTWSDPALGTDLSFDTEGLWDSSVPNRLTVPIGMAGYWFIYGLIDYGNPVGTSTSGWMSASFRKNGSIFLGDHRIPYTGVGQVVLPAPATVLHLNAGDFITLIARHATGHPVTEQAYSGEGSTRLGMVLQSLD